MCTPRASRLASATCVAAMFILSAAPSSAQSRMVTVNGQWLSDPEVAQADQAAGFPLPNGHYWYDANTGLWGVQGGPTIGRVVGPVRGVGSGRLSPFTPPVIDPGGGCEGGSCVNILR
jgi:hypothetical protein